MAIGTPVSQGTHAYASGALSGSSTMTVTTLANIAAGSLIVVATGNFDSSLRSISSVSDSAGNSYVNATTSANGNNKSEIWYKANCAALSSGGTITITFSSSFSAGGGGTACAASVTGVTTVGPLDQVAQNNSASATSITTTTGTLSRANEICFAASYDNDSAGVTYTEASGFSSINSDIASGARLALSYETVAATTAISYTPTFSSAGAIVQPVATFIGPIDTTLTASAGSYALSGAAATLGKLYRLTADAGAYVLAGFAATFPRAVRLTATAGSYILTGAAATLRHGIMMAANAGSYVLSGTSASLKRGFRMTAAPGSYMITGMAVIVARVVTPANKFVIRAADFVLQKLRVNPPTLEK